MSELNLHLTKTLNTCNIFFYFICIRLMWTITHRFRLDEIICKTWYVFQHYEKNSRPLIYLNRTTTVRTRIDFFFSYFLIKSVKTHIPDRFLCNTNIIFLRFMTETFWQKTKKIAVIPWSIIQQLFCPASLYSSSTSKALRGSFGWCFNLQSSTIIMQSC